MRKKIKDKLIAGSCQKQINDKFRQLCSDGFCHKYWADEVFVIAILTLEVADFYTS